MLLDSNIIIYAAQAGHATLRQFIAEHTPAVSVISYIEALGYHSFWSNSSRQVRYCRCRMPWWNGRSGCDSGAG